MFKKSLFVLFMLPLFVACNDDDTTVVPDPKPQNAIRLATDSNLGQILTDSNGNTLYFFSNDTKDGSECMGGCVDAWPIFYAENLTLDEGLTASDFDEITRADGSKQTTYRSWPLYYFANDTNAGDTNGEKVNDIWYVAKPDYTLMYANAQLVGHDGKNYKSDYTEGDEMTKYIVDINGRTMYTFINDRKDTNNFTMPDFSNNTVWPIVEVTLDKIPSILSNSDFGTIDVHGRTQITYKGWPLYYFGGTGSVSGDTNRGDNRGISFPAPGVWPIANADTSEAPES